MLVTWRYRKRKSLIQWFDPRAWIIFYGCFLASTLFFWDVRFLLAFFVIALVVLLTSGMNWHEIRRAFLFIGGFVIFFALLTFLTGRGGEEVYTASTHSASSTPPSRSSAGDQLWISPSSACSSPSASWCASSASP